MQNILDSQVMGGVQVQFGYSDRLSTTLAKWKFMLQDELFCSIDPVNSHAQPISLYLQNHNTTISFIMLTVLY